MVAYIIKSAEEYEAENAELCARVTELEEENEALRCHHSDAEKSIIEYGHLTSQLERYKTACNLLEVALTATSQRTSGYDWNADPENVTLLQGEAFEAAAALRLARGEG